MTTNMQWFTNQLLFIPCNFKPLAKAFDNPPQAAAPGVRRDAIYVAGDGRQDYATHGGCILGDLV